MVVTIHFIYGNWYCLQFLRRFFIGGLNYDPTQDCVSDLKSLLQGQLYSQPKNRNHARWRHQHTTGNHRHVHQPASSKQFLLWCTMRIYCTTTSYACVCGVMSDRRAPGCDPRSLCQLKLVLYHCFVVINKRNKLCSQYIRKLFFGTTIVCVSQFGGRLPLYPGPPVFSKLLESFWPCFSNIFENKMKLPNLDCQTKAQCRNLLARPNSI